MTTLTDEQLKEIFSTQRVIASVGLSSKPDRPSHGVCAYLQRHGYRIIPVNPNEREVLGETSYDNLLFVPEKVDIVQIFRNPDAVPQIVEDAITIGAKVVWMQDGAGHEGAAKRAEEAGLTVVYNDCMLRQHKRLMGE